MKAKFIYVGIAIKYSFIMRKGFLHIVAGRNIGSQLEQRTFCYRWDSYVGIAIEYSFKMERVSSTLLLGGI